MKYLIALSILIASATGFSYNLKTPTYNADVVFDGFTLTPNFDCDGKDCFLFTPELQQVALKIKFKGYNDKLANFEYEVIYLDNHKLKIIATAKVSNLTQPGTGLHIPEQYEYVYITLNENDNYSSDEVEIVVVK